MKKRRFANEADFEQALTKECAGLDRHIEPKQDLWPGILTAMDDLERHVDQESTPKRNLTLVWRLAASVLLVVGSSLATAFWMEQNRPDNFIAEYGPASANFGAGQVLDANYTSVRSELINDLEQRLPNLTPETREIVQQNLQSIEISLAEINVALQSDPNNASLQRLLLATYQQEINMLTHMNQLVGASESIDL